MNPTAMILLAQQAPANGEANWMRALAILGGFALLIAVREAIVWLIHHWPHPRAEAADRADPIEPPGRLGGARGPRRRAR